jgi:ABC-type glycerol-3-phosphate transport system substrate-binding protein
VEAIPILLQSFVSNWLTDGEIDDTHAGKLPWSSGAYKKALQIYVDMNEAGLIFNSPLNLRWAEMERSFYNVREVGVIYDGQWSIAVQRATAPDFTAYRSFRVPRAADAKYAQRSVGQADRNLAVNAKGRHVEESLAFLKWLTDREQAEYLMEAVPMLPTNPAALLDATKIPPQFSAFHIEGPRAMRISTPRKQQVDEALTKGIQALLLKQTDVDRVLADADRAQRS